MRLLVRAVGIRDRLHRNPDLTLQRIAEAEGVVASYATRLLRLSFLAPDIRRGHPSTVAGQNPYHRKGLERRWRGQPTLQRTEASLLTLVAAPGFAKALRIKGISASILITPAVISMPQVVGGAPSLERTCLCPISLFPGKYREFPGSILQ